MGGGAVMTGCGGAVMRTGTASLKHQGDPFHSGSSHLRPVQGGPSAKAAAGKISKATSSWLILLDLEGKGPALVVEEENWPGKVGEISFKWPEKICDGN